MKEMQSSVEIRFVTSYAGANRRGFKIRYHFVPEGTALFKDTVCRALDIKEIASLPI